MKGKVILFAILIVGIMIVPTNIAIEKREIAIPMPL